MENIQHGRQPDRDDQSGSGKLEKRSEIPLCGNRNRRKNGGIRSSRSDSKISIKIIGQTTKNVKKCMGG